MRKVVEWTDWFMGLCYEAAKRSKDSSTQVGACIVKDKRVVAIGYNGFPSGVEETEKRWTRPLKYQYVVHAEANAIAQSARFGVPLDGATIYLTLHPCIGCAKLIAQSGIKEVVYDNTHSCEMFKTDTDEQWIAHQILKESGVSVNPYAYTPSTTKNENSLSTTSTTENPSNG